MSKDNEQKKFDSNVRALTEMPDWEFCLVFRDGIGDACAGANYNGVYYSEVEIAAAYRAKWPDADPLF